MSHGRRLIGWALLASLASHLLSVWWFPSRPGRAATPNANVVEFELLRLTSRPHVVPLTALATDRHQSNPHNAPKSQRAKAKVPVGYHGSTSAKVPVQRHSDLPAVETPESQDIRDEDLQPAPVTASDREAEASLAMVPSSLWPTLNPRNVALNAYLSTPSARCADDGAKEDTAAQHVERATKRLDAYLANAARPQHLQERPPPNLHSSTDGRYHYQGPSFTAVIDADGAVHFHDRAPVELHLSSTVLTFDVNDVLERTAGNDPYSAEKQWFLAATATLRADLEEQAHAERFAKARLHLRGKLLSIVQSTRSTADQHQAIFSLWDDCAPDDIGREAQQLIEAFIRVELPEGSPLAFAPQELARLNVHRFSRHPFNPY